MAKIEVTPKDCDKGREVLVNGIPIPDVTDVSLFVRPTDTDEVTITIKADSFRSNDRLKTGGE